MPEAHIKWLDGRQFVGVDSSKHSVVMSSQDSQNGIGMKPAELLLVALGGCTAYDVVNILEKKRQPLAGLEIIVTGQQAADPPWPYRKIHVEYILRGQGLSEKAVAQAIELSEEKYCSVSATVKGMAEITTSYRIENIEPAM
jgi:putative redox protein